MSKGRPAYAAIVTGSVPACRLWSCATAVTDHERFTTLAEFKGVALDSTGKRNSTLVVPISVAAGLDKKVNLVLFALGKLRGAFPMGALIPCPGITMALLKFFLLARNRNRALIQTKE